MDASIVEGITNRKSFTSLQAVRPLCRCRYPLIFWCSSQLSHLLLETRLTHTTRYYGIRCTHRKMYLYPWKHKQLLKNMIRRTSKVFALAPYLRAWFWWAHFLISFVSFQRALSIHKNTLIYIRTYSFHVFKMRCIHIWYLRLVELYPLHQFSFHFVARLSSSHRFNIIIMNERPKIEAKKWKLASRLSLFESVFVDIWTRLSNCVENVCSRHGTQSSVYGWRWSSKNLSENFRVPPKICSILPYSPHTRLHWPWAHLLLTAD